MDNSDCKTLNCSAQNVSCIIMQVTDSLMLCRKIHTRL